MRHDTHDSIRNGTKRCNYKRYNLTKSYFTYEPLTKSRVNKKLFFFSMGSKETGINLTELSIKNSYHLSGIVTHSASQNKELGGLKCILSRCNKPMIYTANQNLKPFTAFAALFLQLW